MENIIITPRNKRQSSVIKSLFKEMDIPFRKEKIEVTESEGDKYYPILDEKIKKALKEEKEGQTIKINMRDIAKSIREYEDDL